ncbi:MAG: electron transfer flavoprotein subunit alpha/FixB family protein [Chloroflexi bacterium]|nr:electron transfer flavoprotein subunit alpha/FixB family protein [Chloroflexota bacterium]MDL1942279.1 electron transfer flavoprotein subunit alpha/FixB family protein [Chloroflexi bacterium CFX2]
MMSQDIYVVIEHLRGQVADISYTMLAAARELSQATSGKVVAVLLGHNAKELAKDFAANQVLYLNHAALTEFTSDAYQKTLADLISKDQPRAVLFGNTSIGADVASVLSMRLSLPIVSSCRSFTSDGKFVAQICGGKIMAEGGLPSPTALVTMVPGGYQPDQGRSVESPPVTESAVPALDALRVTLSRYIEPESADVDISKEPLLIAVGRGIQNKDNIELADALAQAIGGVVCGSRPVIDQGWLSTSRLVGKSGKQVKPKIYFALGISGAPEHVEAITQSDTIIAVNTDPKAPIFDIAKYGIQMDLFELVEVLTEHLKAKV